MTKDSAGSDRKYYQVNLGKTNLEDFDIFESIVLKVVFVKMFKIVICFSMFRPKWVTFSLSER